VRVSQISQDFEEIQEIEINPLMVQENGCIAVDALVVISGDGSTNQKTWEVDNLESKCDVPTLVVSSVSERVAKL